MSDASERVGHQEHHSPRQGANRPRIVIEYCPRCGWLLRAAWLAQEVLTTFSEDLSEVALRPGGPGTFRIRVDDSVVWDRRDTRGFPQAAELKRLVRDIVAPAKDLGHSQG